ncbi:hypothetical protein ATZ36_09705 [Candidatus Endomicrobiellum trichonymphae]|uniref:Uncharacterized protein n=1 Tax=Endomicrobium trichonymphae TaxID=1408204 RepID=A0A1E5IFY5_ENDTX|nr:hypothetical protein ATZ36_09705 [Candidatus Endomicrobium trichonymphae]
MNLAQGFDPISTAKVEESMIELKQRYTIVLVTNNVKQASRVSDMTAFFFMGRLVEIDKTDKLFVSPKEKQTEDYITRPLWLTVFPIISICRPNILLAL